MNYNASQTFKKWADVGKTLTLELSLLIHRMYKIKIEAPKRWMSKIYHRSSNPQSCCSFHPDMKKTTPPSTTSTTVLFDFRQYHNNITQFPCVLFFCTGVYDGSALPTPFAALDKVSPAFVVWRCRLYWVEQSFARFWIRVLHILYLQISQVAIIQASET